MSSAYWGHEIKSGRRLGYHSPHSDITKTPIYVPEGEGEINVCEAVKDMINESRQEGKVEGKAEGRIEGREEGKAEGKIQMLKELVKDGTLSVVEAAAKAEMTVEQFEKELDKFTKLSEDSGK